MSKNEYEKEKEKTLNKVPIRQLINFDNNQEDVKISVVIPIFNVETYLPQCLDSVINQTFTDIEIICVNDGSTDKSLDILKEYLKKDNRIKIIDKENAGYGHTMNIGLDMASGKYFVIVESDDFIQRDMFETLYDVAEKNNLDFVKSDFYRFYGEDEKIILDYQKLDPTNKYYNKIVSTQDDHKTYNLLMNTWTGLYNISFLQENNIRHNETPGASYQDNGFWFKTLFHGKRVMFLPKPFYMYRRDNPNSSVKNKEKVYSMDTEYDLIHNFLDNESQVDNFSDAFTLAKYNNFHFTIDRIDVDFKKDFLINTSKLFNEMKAKGELNDSLLDEYGKKVLKWIMEDPENYFDYHYVLDEKDYDNLNKFMTCRVDIKNRGNKFNDLILIDCDDPSCTIYQPEWFKNEEGIGTVISSISGSTRLTFRCVNDGNVLMDFKGIDFKSKNGDRIPLYVDYTEIIVNDEILLSGSIVSWHDKPFVFEKEVSHGEILNIQIKWRPLNTESNIVLLSDYELQMNQMNTCRVDIKNRGSSENKVKLIEADSNFVLQEPDWFKNQEGIGTVITSSSCEMNFTLKCINRGNLLINFKGINFSDKQGNRLPIIIDYETIEIDGVNVISENTIAWHDKPIFYEKNVEDGQLIKVNLKWNHINSRSDTILLSDKDKHLKKFSQSRIDIKNQGNNTNSIELVCNDPLANINYPDWFKQENGVGAVVTSVKDAMDLSIKCINDGELLIKFKGIDYRNKNNERIPIYIDYTEIIVDNEVIVDDNFLTWHDKPFIYRKEVKNNQIVNVHFKWLPVNKNSKYMNILTKKDIQKLNKEISNKDSEIEKLSNQLKELKTKNTQLKETKNKLLNSNSWQLTNSLRKIRNFRK